MAAGVLAYAGKMDLTTAMAVAFVANFIGDNLLFYMSRYQKSDMMAYFKSHRRKLALSHVLMKKHGDWVIFLQKYVYGIKTLIPLAIGLTKYDFKRFAIINLAASAIWAVVVGGASFYAGSAIMSAYDIIAQKPYYAPIILITIIGIIWFYFSFATRKKTR
jgi:membrane protein DedA with SNARE-associated domain